MSRGGETHIAYMIKITNHFQFAENREVRLLTRSPSLSSSPSCFYCLSVITLMVACKVQLQEKVPQFHYFPENRLFHSKLREQAQQGGDDIVIEGTGSGETGTTGYESISLYIRGLPSDVHTVEVVKSVDTHHVEIETEGDVISVKIFLTADDDRCVIYNLHFYSTV